MQITSSVSAAAALTMVIAFFKVPGLQKKSYFQLQFFVAVSNLLTSIGSAIGAVETGTVACWFQGMLTNIFTLSSIHWTTVMTFSLFSIVYFEKQIDINLWVHLYCWVPPILASVLPLINTTYGNAGNWCWVVETKHTPSWGYMFWFWFSFYGWVWWGLLSMSVFLISTYVKASTSTAVNTKKSLRHIISKLEFYPVIIAFSWGIACISDTEAELGGGVNSEFSYATSIFACMQGVCTALVFWLRDEDMRKYVTTTHPMKIYVGPVSNATSSSAAPKSSSVVSNTNAQVLPMPFLHNAIIGALHHHDDLLVTAPETAGSVV